MLRYLRSRVDFVSYLMYISLFFIVSNCFLTKKRLHFIRIQSKIKVSPSAERAFPIEPMEYFYVTPQGLNIQVLSTEKKPIPSVTNIEPTNLEKINMYQQKGFKKFKRFEIILDKIESLWKKSIKQDKTKKLVGLSGSSTKTNSPLIFIHGSFHAAW